MTFSEASGLCMNKNKSDVYLNGVNDSLATNLVRLAGFQLGQFPFRYLGVPISYKRLSVADCSRVVDKIVARIRGWGAKHLSYAGRLVLVKAVLTQLHVYWARIFLLPKRVIHKVESICRNYLWAGTAEYKHSPPVAWETCCLPKEHGGLGIVNCSLWNAALLGKYACWAWKQICKIKEMLKPGFLNGAWDGAYTIQKGYTWLLGPNQKKDWAPLVWNRVCVPKHNFSTWIFVQQRFLTQDRMNNFVLAATADMVTDPVAGRCGGLAHSVEMLFLAQKAGGYGSDFRSDISHLGMQK
ncbi:uncharacterized protein LOC141651914 [Silene latifolia]|uniref:uncharacterized protein LOC141651914 n=1 Tax=Silene latifolia TaxID=37657 RepID=UPI003D78A5B9